MVDSLELSVKSMPHDAVDAAMLSCDYISQRVAYRCGASPGVRKLVAQVRTRSNFAGGMLVWPIRVEAKEVD